MLSMVAVLMLGMSTTEPDPAMQPIQQAQTPSQHETVQDLNLRPRMIEKSPVLQRWLEEVPDLDADIRHDPAIQPRLRVGYSHPLSEEGTSQGWVGIEDIFIDDSALSLSGEYRTSLEDPTDESYGGELRYYLRPLGSRINLAPVAGYRAVTTRDVDVSGVSVGVRLVLALSRNGASDISLSQTWIDPGSDTELGVTSISTGYAVTSHVRIGTEFQVQNSDQTTQHQLGLGLEWLF